MPIQTIICLFSHAFPHTFWKRFIISSMYNFQQEGLICTSHIHPIKLFTIFLFLFTCSHAQICTQEIFQNSTGRQCVFRYSYICNNTQFYRFNSCKYTSCLDQTPQGTCKAFAPFSSSDLTGCGNICIKQADQSTAGKNWIAITVIVLCILLSMIICGCIARRCCNGVPERNQFMVHMRPPSTDENEIDSQRRLSSWNYLEYQLKWEKMEANRQWIDQQEACVICLEKQLHCYLPCRHYFHKNCIKEWLSLKPNCPTCKAQRFDQVILRCRGCRVMQMSFFVEQLKKVEIEDKCPSCK